MNTWPKQIRAFIGCPLAHPDRNRLTDWTRDCLGPGWRPVSPQNLHLTVCFLGEQPSPTLALLARELKTLGPLSSGSGRGDQPQRFPSPTAPLLALELSPDTHLLDLHAAVTAVTTQRGLPTGRLPFRPHITLARGGGSYIRQPLNIVLHFTQLCLFASVPGKATYARLSEQALAQLFDQLP